MYSNNDSLIRDIKQKDINNEDSAEERYEDNLKSATEAVTDLSSSEESNSKERGINFYFFEVLI
jgi:hypothetical protein